ncbi:tyrosine-type recombinase/integrase, partial [Candidatus Regiella insecticola]
ATEWFKIKQSSITANHARDVWRSLERDIFPVVGQVGIQEIKARTLITALEPVKAKGALETVKRLTQRLNEIMIFAVNCGLIDANPAGGIGKAFEKPKKKNRPALTPRELPELMQALSVASIELQTRLLIEWQLLTITRPSEAAGARWSEINYDLREWRIPAERMKMRRDHVIHLSSQALAVLDALKPISAHKNYLFPSSKNALQPMNSQTANAAIQRMGYRGRLVAHGMRSIASTALNEKEFNPDVIEAVLAHTGRDSVRNAYNRSSWLEQRKVLMDWWGEFVERAATGKFTAAESVRRIKGESDKLRTIEFK